MMRLRICAFGALVITCTAASAQNAQSTLDTSDRITGIRTEIQTIGLDAADQGPVLLGQDKTAPLCPSFCVPRRVTSPEQATVGEREVITYTMALAASGTKLHVDSRRAAWTQVEKFPSTASAPQSPTIATQNEFRPALDPVLAEPITDQLE